MTTSVRFDNENQDATHDKIRTPKDISTFSRSHPLKAVGQTRSLDFTASKGKGDPVAYVSTEQSRPDDNECSDCDRRPSPRRGAAGPAGGRREASSSHCRQTDPTIDGVVVLDDTTVGHLALPEGSDAIRYFVLGNEASDSSRLWHAGVRRLLPDKHPLELVLCGILYTELLLSPENPPGMEMQSSDRDQNWPNCPYVFHWHNRPIGAHLKRGGERRVSAPGYPVSSSMTCGVPPFATWNAPACRATSRWELQGTGRRQSTADTTWCPRKTCNSLRLGWMSSSKRNARIKRRGTWRRNGASRAQIGHSEGYPNPQAIENLVSRAGLEPATTALKVRCSTN
jgi:hypothetical protein